MSQKAKASDLETGDHIKVNGTLHTVTDTTEDTVTTTARGETSTEYLQSGIDVGKVTIC